MCECKEIMRIWNKSEKSEEDERYLITSAPVQFKMVDKISDEHGLHYVLECKVCKETQIVPHI